MNLKQLEKKILEVLNNLESVNVTNSLKAKAILDEVEEFYESGNKYGQTVQVSKEEHANSN